MDSKGIRQGMLPLLHLHVIRSGTQRGANLSQIRNRSARGSHRIDGPEEIRRGMLPLFRLHVI